MGKRGKKKAGRPVRVDRRKLLSVFRAGQRPLHTGEIMRALGLKKSQRESLVRELDALTEQGKLIRTRSAYGLVDKMNLMTGRLEVTRSGVGFVIPEDSRIKDVFIPERELGDAWHGDRVVAAVVRQRRGKNHEGRIVRVLKRGRSALSVVVVRRVEQSVYLCRPTEARMNFAVMAEHSGGKLHPGDLCLVAPGEKIDHNLWEGRINAVLGREEDVAAQEAVTKSNHAIPTKFPEEVLQQAEELPQAPSKEDMRGRRDLRAMKLVTIDGADARDFDDAVHVEKRGGGWMLTVAIADVSHYVPPFSKLDREAYERGNSYYFPMSVEPMFPEKLSNGLCSLNPGVDRLAMVAQVEFSGRGVPGRTEFFPAVIKSSARLTYTQVERAVIEREPQAREEMDHVIDMLDEAERLARKLTDQRNRRGSLDFELPEPEVELDEKGKVMSVRARKTSYSHRVIEEFMVAANEAVARYLTENGPACLYRIHPEADSEKLASMYKVLVKAGSSITPPTGVEPADLQELIAQAAGTELEFLVNRMLLRSMKQARYSPEDEGHFGLASDSYCHFTSPIRRYADLVVHRLLKVGLGDQSKGVPGQAKLKEIADQLYTCERKAMDAEREMDRRVAALYLLDHIGDTFTGVVSSIADFGFRVELAEVLAEGTVRLSTMADDYYAYFKDREMLVGERTGRALRLGDKVEVRLADVNLAALEVDLSLVSGGADFKNYVD